MDDHIPLDWREIEVALCIVQRMEGMREPMPAVGCRCALVPVVEEIVMQKRTRDKVFHMEGEGERMGDAEGYGGDREAVL